MDTVRRTRRPWPPWVKGTLAVAVMALTVFATVKTADDGPTYVSVAQAVSGDYGPGDALQVHGDVRNVTRDDFLLFEDNHTLRVLVADAELPGTFAEDKGATVTGTLAFDGGELVLVAESIQVGCPSKYEPDED